MFVTDFVVTMLDGFFAANRVYSAYFNVLRSKLVPPMVEPFDAENYGLIARNLVELKDEFFGSHLVIPSSGS